MVSILIVGQGLAGSVLGWEFERAGISFAIIDAGHATSVSRMAAGIINPITGLRLVKSWIIDASLPIARDSYRAFEQASGVSVWRDMQIRRLFADDKQREVFFKKQATGELAPFAGEADAEGFWIHGAARVELAVFLEAARRRWRSTGVLREERVDWETALAGHELVIDCTGRASGRFGFIPWEYSKGEIISVAVTGLEPDVILNRGHWMLPCGDGAKVGATHEPGCTDMAPTRAAKTALEKSAALLLKREFTVRDQHAGVRVNLPDRRPVVGRHPENPRFGILNGLGAKGVLLSPWLARQWVNHLTQGVPFDREVDTVRFWHRHLSQA